MVRKTLTQKPNFNGRISVQIILTIQFFCCDNRCSLKRIRNQTLFRCGITLLWLASWHDISTKKKRMQKKHQKLSSVLQKQWTNLKVWCEQTEKRNTNTVETENSRKRPPMWDPKTWRGPNETKIKNRDYWNKRRQKRRGGRQRVAHTRRRVVWNLAARDDAWWMLQSKIFGWQKIGGFRTRRQCPCQCWRRRQEHRWWQQDKNSGVTARAK